MSIGCAWSKEQRHQKKPTKTKRNENDENTPQGKWQNVTALRPGHRHRHGHGHGLGPLAWGSHRSWSCSWGLKELPKIRLRCKSAYDSNRTRTLPLSPLLPFLPPCSTAKSFLRLIEFKRMKPLNRFVVEAAPIPCPDTIQSLWFGAKKSESTWHYAALCVTSTRVAQ